MKPTGLRSHRVQFQRRTIGAGNDAGNVLEEWVIISTVWASYKAQISFANTEPLKAGRLQSSVSGVLNVYSSSQTAGVTAADRVVFLTPPYDRFGVCQIQAVIPTGDNREIEFVIEGGLPT